MGVAVGMLVGVGDGTLGLAWVIDEMCANQERPVPATAVVASAVRPSRTLRREGRRLSIFLGVLIARDAGNGTCIGIVASRYKLCGDTTGSPIVLISGRCSEGGRVAASKASAKSCTL